MIHMTVKIVLEKSRNATAYWSGKSSALLLGSRIKNRHIDTFVHMRVANVWIHSPYVYFMNSCKWWGERNC